MVPHLGIWVGEYLILTKTRVSPAPTYLVRMPLLYFARFWKVVEHSRFEAVLYGSRIVGSRQDQLDMWRLWWSLLTF